MRCICAASGAGLAECSGGSPPSPTQRDAGLSWLEWSDAHERQPATREPARGIGTRPGANEALNPPIQKSRLKTASQTHGFLRVSAKRLSGMTSTNNGSAQPGPGPSCVAGTVEGQRAGGVCCQETTGILNTSIGSRTSHGSRPSWLPARLASSMAGPRLVNCGK